MKVTRRQINQNIKEEAQAQMFVELVNESAGKAIGDAISSLMKDEKFRALIVMLLTQAATDWVPNWLRNRKEKKQLDVRDQDLHIDYDADGIPDEDEYMGVEDEITQVIDRRQLAEGTRRQLRRLILEEARVLQELSYDEARAKINQVRDPVVREILNVLMQDRSGPVDLTL